MSSPAGDPARYGALADRCRMLEATQAELRHQFTELLLLDEEKDEERERRPPPAAVGDDEDEAAARQRIAGRFSRGSPCRRILESIGHAVHVCSASSGEIIYWNRSAEILYGWKDDEVVRKRMDQLLVCEPNHAHLQNILDKLAFRRPWSGQFPFKRQSGEVFMAMVTMSLLYEDGEIVGVIFISSDAAHFNSSKMECQAIPEEIANGQPRGPTLKRIQWHPPPQIASSVSNLASKILSRRGTIRGNDRTTAEDRTDAKDNLLKKPVKLAEKFLERLYVGGNKGCTQEQDEISRGDRNDSRQESDPLIGLKKSTSSQGAACVEDRNENFTGSNSALQAREIEYSDAKTRVMSSDRECCQCFDMPKPEDLFAPEGGKVSEQIGGEMALQKDGETAEKACRNHEERCTSSGESMGSCGSESSKGNRELSSLIDCEIHWDDLQIGEEIGQGSYAVVHRGIWKGSDVAIKVYFANDYAEKTLLDYKKEIDIMKRLRHPNVLLFMGAVYSQERLAIVTEFLPRGSLFRALHKSKQPMDIRRRMRMGLDVVRGMNYLHHRNPPILHRDLKSSNLLVDRNWNVKVGDFGLSRLKNATLLATTSVRGTPQWMAPEVLRNEPSNEKSDVFSFGVVLWELMTRSIPWNNLNSLQVVGAVGFMDRRLDIPEGIDPEMASIIQDCWHSEPNLRPSFEDILKRMSSFLRKTMVASEQRSLES